MTRCHQTTHSRIDWDGILVDDPDHQDDIVRRAREVLEQIWKDRADAIEKEACDTLGMKSLRDYFRKPAKRGLLGRSCEAIFQEPPQGPDLLATAIVEEELLPLGFTTIGSTGTFSIKPCSTMSNRRSSGKRIISVSFVRRNPR